MNVELLLHELLGATDEYEYTAALPVDWSVTTMLASVSGATACDRSDAETCGVTPVP
jgi:hypothetical protein